MIKRIIKSKIKTDFFKGKIITVLGPRQVGKTTLLTQLLDFEEEPYLLNCDDFDDCALLEGKTSTELRNLLGGKKYVVIDEAQRVKNIGLTLKIIADLKLDTQVLVTGSSSLDLANGINEPVTGRMYEYQLYPFSMGELVRASSIREEKRMLGQRLVYGFYPEVVNNIADAKRTLMTLANNYLYKDLLSYKGLRKPEILQKLLRALALQVGSEVSYNELSKTVGVDKETIENYINLLEKSFVIFRLNAFSRNLRTEITKGKKVYFYDNGVRNAIIGNFSPLETRNDEGPLFENMVVSEFVKRNAYNQTYANLYFWRTTQQQEIDLIYECDGKLTAYEIKYNPTRKASLPKTFSEAYPDTDFIKISSENVMEEFL